MTLALCLVALGPLAGSVGEGMNSVKIARVFSVPVPKAIKQSSKEENIHALSRDKCRFIFFRVCASLIAVLRFCSSFEL